jgi:putative membrane protein
MSWTLRSKAGAPSLAQASSPEKDPRVYFAAERTYLAWIRTGLALMGFGFVVARFGLFLKELGQSRPELGVKSLGFSLGLGIGLIVIGVLVNLSSTLTHYRVISRLNQGLLVAGRPSFLAMLVAITLALGGVAMAIYLIAMG